MLTFGHDRTKIPLTGQISWRKTSDVNGGYLTPVWLWRLQIHFQNGKVATGRLRSSESMVPVSHTEGNSCYVVLNENNYPQRSIKYQVFRLSCLSEAGLPTDLTGLRKGPLRGSFLITLLAHWKSSILADINLWGRLDLDLKLTETYLRWAQH